MSNSFDKSSGSNMRWLWWVGGGCFGLLVCLCIAGIAGVLLIPDSTIQQVRQLAGLTQESASIEFVPKDAPAFVVVNPNWSQLANAKKVADIFEKNSAFKKRVEELQKEATTDSDFNFERDVKPWIGAEIAIAAFDLKSLQRAGANADPEIIILAPTRDKAQSDAALAGMRKRAEGKGTTFSEEKYKEVTIMIGKAKSGANNSLAYTTYQNQVMLADKAETIKQALDTKAAGDAANLKANANYKSVLGKLPTERAGMLYLDMQEVTRLASANSPATPNLATIEGYMGFGVSFGFAEDGLRFDMVTTYDKAKLMAAQKKLLEAMKANPGKAMEATHSSALLTLAFQDMKTIWEYTSEIIKQDPDIGRNFDKNLADIKRQTGIDVSEDIFGWMTGEFAITVVPAKPIRSLGATAPGAGLLLLIEAKDQALVKSKLDKLSKVMAQTGDLSFATKKINGVDMQVVRGLETQGLSFGYGFVDNFLVIGSAEDVLGLAVDGKKSALSADPDYQKAAKLFSQPNYNTGYFAVQKLIDLVKPTLNRRDQEQFQKEVEPLLKPFKSISFSSGLPKDDATTGVFYIRVGE